MYFCASGRERFRKEVEETEQVSDEEEGEVSLELEVDTVKGF